MFTHATGAQRQTVAQPEAERELCSSQTAPNGEAQHGAGQRGFHQSSPERKKKCYPRITLFKLLIYYLIFITVYGGLSKLSEVLGYLPTRTGASP